MCQGLSCVSVRQVGPPPLHLPALNMSLFLKREPSENISLESRLKQVYIAQVATLKDHTQLRKYQH